MAMPTLQDRDWTVAMLRALPDDGNRYEIIDGELLVSPAPSFRHQRALGELYLLIGGDLRDTRLEVLFAPFAVTWSERTEVQPDLLVFAMHDFEGDYDGAGLRLVVEVLSPSTARHDRHRKRLEYQRRGVPEYWIVDVDACLIERWRPGDERPEVVVDTLTWLPIDGIEPLTIDLETFFARIHRR